MIECDKCKSERLLVIGAKHVDHFYFSYKNIECKFPDYAPRVDNICAGDYTDPTICLDCGKVQGKFPVSDENILEKLDENEYE